MSGTFGVLALQGDFAPHLETLRAIGVEGREVRRCAQLEGLAGLILPGGESTTLLNLMQDEPWFDALRRFHAGGGVIFGTCAGAILLSSEVVRPAQPSLGLLDAMIERNGYGRQQESFEAQISIRGLPRPVHAAFIRAPRFRRLGAGVEVLATWRDEPVLVREGRVLAGTFHPELTGETALHRLFVEMAGSS